MKCKVCDFEHDLCKESTPFKKICIETACGEYKKMKNMRDLLINKLQEKIKENELLKAWKYKVKHAVNEMKDDFGVK